MSKANTPEHSARRPRFTTRRVLGATFWMAVGFTALALMLRTDAKALAPQFGLAVTYVVVTAPTLALGTLTGWTIYDILIGTAFWMFGLLLFL